MGNPGRADEDGKMKVETVTVRDGVSIAVALYLPESGGPFPALLAASPYRFDNNVLAPSSQFLWRETGPIELYVEHGYAYVNMDVRGCGRSGGNFEFLGKNEQHDLYDVVHLHRHPDLIGRSDGVRSGRFWINPTLDEDDRYFGGRLKPNIEIGRAHV